MADQLLSTDPAAGQLLSTDPAAGVSGSPAVAAATSNQPAGSAVGRFVSGVAQNLNPISIVSGITQAVAHPLDTAKAQWDALEAERGKAYDLAKQGRYSEAVGHFAAGVLPLIGPPAAHAGERIASGDVAGGLGEGVGLIAPAVLPVAKAGAGAATETARAIPGVTEVLERGATAPRRSRML